jgi:hypothetical protein
VIALAALVAIRGFRFPLLAAVAALASWCLVTDALSSGGNWSAVVTLVVAVAFLRAGVRIDRGRLGPTASGSVPSPA